MPRSPLMLPALAVALCMGCGAGYRQRTVSYDPALGDSGQLDLYVPSGPSAPGPGVLLLHPGGWNSGSRADLSEQAARLARSGYVVANANYRLAPAVHFPVPLQDAWCALAYFRAHATSLHLDPKRVAVLGYSAGANFSEMLGLAPAEIPQRSDCPSGITSPPDAVIAGDGPADLLHLPSLGDSQVAQYVGATKSADPGLYREASPLDQVVSGTPPFLLLHGTGDLYVSVDQARQMRAALLAHSDPVTLLLLGGSGHTLNPGADFGAGDNLEFTIDSPEGWAVILDFLKRTVGAPP